MLNSESCNRRRSASQFSLSTLLLAALLLGPVIGFGAPLVVQIVREWNPPAPLPPLQPLFEGPSVDTDSSGFYYESGETPLR